ncbi:MAG: ComEC/Rec2 family competence protein, partial [Candidatus Margulisiibacteriota bacterium]
MKKRIHPSFLLLTFILSFISACFLADSFSFPWYYFSILLIFPIFTFLKYKKYLVISIFLIFGILLGFFWYKYYIYRNQELVFNKSDMVCGKVSESKEFNNQYLLQINSNSIGNSKNNIKFFALTFENPKTLNNLVCLKGEIVKIDSQNSLVKYAKNKSIFYEIKKSEVTNATSLKFKENLFEKYISKLQGFAKNINLKIMKTLPDPEASFISGLLLGKSNQMPESLKLELSKTGTTHLIALSGFNITIIISFIMFLLKPFPRRITYIITILAIFSFVIMTGFSSSIVRAALMAGILMIAKSFGRLSTQGIVISLAAFLIALFNPMSLRFDIGFQLSFLATIGLVYLSPLVEKSLARYFKNIPIVIFE